MTHPLPVPTPPRHSPACRSLSESTLALEPWDHRLPSSRFALLQRQPSPARSGASRVSPGRGTRRACPARPQRCLLHPWGTGLATQCRWLAPPPDVSAPLTPWVSLGRPETSCAPLPVEYSTECRSGDASIQKTTLPRALGCQLLSSDPTCAISRAARSIRIGRCGSACPSFWLPCQQPGDSSFRCSHRQRSGMHRRTRRTAASGLARQQVAPTFSVTQ